MTLSSFMTRALRLAKTAHGLSNPNPPVGAVVVQQGRVVGEGRTQVAGDAHAEVIALREAGESAKGASLYVTLEPCRHYGRTPPCTDAVIAAGIVSVHLTVADPNSTAGGGARVLEEAGIRVVWEEGGALVESLYRAHRKHAITGLPWVIAKYAASLDGKIATAKGESRWITGPRAREEAHRLRSQVDAVIVGAGTIAVDDPLLTARPRGRLWPRQPLRVVVGGAGRVSPEAQVFHQEGQALAVTCAELSRATAEQFESLGVRTLTLPGKEGKVDLLALLRHLGQQPMTSVLVEGGSELLGSFFDQRLVDEVYTFLAPTIIGGAAALTAVGGVGASEMAEALRLREVSVRRLGQDVLVHGRLVWEE